MTDLTEEKRAELNKIVLERAGDISGLDEQEARKKLITIIKDDFYLYCAKNLRIRDIYGQIVPLEPNYAQQTLLNGVFDDLVNGREIRYIVLKARKMGLSTIIEALGYWWTATHKNITSVIMAHDKDGNDALYEMFRRYYDYSHKDFKPDRKYNTRHDLTFDVEDKVKEEYTSKGLLSPGLASQIKTMVAKEGKGRGDTIMFFHGSEVASWDTSADVLSGALQAIPSVANTFAFLESTAQGVGGYFYNEWQHAKKGESAFKAFFFAWHEHPDYERNEVIEHYDEEELELIEIFKEKGYPEEKWNKKLAWRRYKLNGEFRSDPAKFYQEYPKNDTEAFLASGRPVFDIRSLIKMEKLTEGVEPTFGYIKEVEVEHKKTYVLDEVKRVFQNQDPAPLKIWELPEDKVKYVCAADVADGIEIAAEKVETDYSVIEVMRSDTLKTVARWRGHIDPDLLGDEILKLATFYNYALVGVEVNNHGLTTVQSLRNKFYRNLYMRETSQEDQFQERTSKMGWRTDRKTKPKIINELQAAIREGALIDYDPVFIEECKSYVFDDQGRTNAQEGTFDDTVMAKAINLHLADWQKYDTVYAREQIHKPTKRQIHGTNESLDSIANPTGRKRSSNVDAVSRRKQARRRHTKTSR